LGHWKVTLDGYPDCDFGDVTAIDGEVMGTWACDENDFFSFTPHGEPEPIFLHPMLGLFCAKIAEWHEDQDFDAIVVTSLSGNRFLKELNERGPK